MTRRLTSRVAAGFAAVAVALTGLSAAVASAADDAVSGQTPPSSIDKNTKGSLTVHKLTPSSVKQDPGNGTVLEALPEGSKPINGVKFTVKKVNGVDLTKNADWKKVATIMNGTLDSEENPTKVTANGTDYTLAGVTNGSQTTAGKGEAKFADLEVGLYLVSETVEGTVNVVDGEQNVPKTRVNRAKPFFVTIPMTNPKDRATWMYDIHAYPKNSLSTVPKKTVDDDKAGIGSGNTVEAEKSTITYKLSAVVPSVPTIERFELVDKFKTSQLEWIEDGANDTVSIYDGENKVVDLVKDTDYTFSTVKKGTGDNKDYSFVAVELTETGRAKLAKSYGGKTLTWTFHAKALDTKGATEVPNEPFLNEGPKGWTVTEPGTPGPGVKSYYGKVIISKKTEGNDKLPGAKFALYECSETGYTDPINNKTIPGGFELKEENRVSVDGVNEWTSDTAEGKIVIDGLLVNDFRNNSKFLNGKNGDTWASKSFYCLKEIQAPEGYELLPNPVKFQINSMDKTGAVNLTDKTLEVHNNKTPGLPVTGGAGIATLVGGGVLLLAGSAIYAFAANRKRKLS